MAPLIFQLTSDALSPLQLDVEPIGWDAMRYLFERDTKRHGITFSVSVDLTFVKQAAAYLRLVYEGGQDQSGATVPAKGVEGLVVLTVYEQDPNELQPVEIYRGRLDFTTYESAENGVTAKFKELGFATSLMTRGDTEVDLFGAESLSGVALPAYTPVTATLHSQETRQRFEMRQNTTATTLYPATLISGNGIEENSALLFFGMENVVFNELGISPFALGPEPGDSYSSINIPFYTAKASGQHIVRVYLDTTIRVYQTQLGVDFNQVDIKFHFRKNGSPASATDLITPFHGSPGGTASGNGRSYRLTAAARTFTLQLEPGDRLYLYGEVYVHDWTNSTHTAFVTCAMGAGSYLTVTALTKTTETACPGLLVHEALSRCFEAATDQRNAFYSDYYGRPDTRTPYPAIGAGALRLITNGFLLRGFPLTSAPAPITGQTDTRKTITVSPDDLYDSLDAIDCLGMGTETRAGQPVVRVEPRAYFYQSAEVLRLGAVTGLKKTVYKEWLYNSAEVGYGHWQSGAANGLDEFNGQRSYSLPLTQLKKAYLAISTLNAAGYLIEEARRDRYQEGATKEGQADAEAFVVCVRQSNGGWVSEQDEAFVPGSINGIVSPKAYNLRLSPGRMLANHGPWLRSGLAAQANKRLLIGAIQGNAHLSSRLVGETGTIVDNEALDVPVSELAPPLVLAETYEFTARVRRGEMAVLQTNPYGQISFLDSLGTRKYGYLLRAERTPQGGLTTFTLLRAAE